MVDKKFVVKKGVFGKKKENAFQLNFVGNFKEKKVLDFLTKAKFTLLK